MSAIQSFDTVYPADSVEFCPSPQNRDYLVCGTYYLQTEQVETSNEGDNEVALESGKEPKPQTRLGKCWLLKVDDSGHFEAVHVVDMPAVLDLKWSYAQRDAPRIAIADAVGCVRFHDLQTVKANDRDLDESGRLVHVQTLQCGPPDTICLSLDWSDRLDSDPAGKIVASISDGSLCVAQVEGTYRVASQWHAHDYEPWIAAWNYWNTSVVYSGGDDLAWKAWDLRTELASPVFSNRRGFEGGVTSIQSHPHMEHVVAVGSYDSQVRIFDTRKYSVPVVALEVGGGAWRVKWHPSVQRKHDLLVACMHDGFKVIRWGGDATSQISKVYSTISDYRAHSSLAYGVDWRNPGADSGAIDETLIASGSFYDHLLTTWRG